MLATTNLLPHQALAVEKLFACRVGALFMEMGTGKSRTAIELVVRRQARIDHVVWVCPVSLKQTIRAEILKHTTAQSGDICVFDDKTSERTLGGHSWYVVGLESMSASKRVVLAVNALVTERTFVIVDESSYIKGHRAARTARITKIAERALYRLILTGTPISQGVVDLYSQMRFLSPRILGYNSFYSFAANHLEYSERFSGMIVRAHNVEYIAAKIQPYVYQVTKAESIELPAKLYEERVFRLGWEQQDAYDAAKQEILATIERVDDWNSVVIFRLFTALQQIASGFWPRRRPGQPMELLEFPHKRLDALLNIVRDIPAQERVIIWAKFAYDIEAIRLCLTAEYGNECCVAFYGKVPEKRRNAAVETFRASARFFVATQSCGGHGLTLNEAHHVIFYNNSFKYSERLQAEDRCHRIGQTHPVTYIDIWAACGIDDRIASAHAKKGNAVEEFKTEVSRVKDKASIVGMIKDL